MLSAFLVACAPSASVAVHADRTVVPALLDFVDFLDDPRVAITDGVGSAQDVTVVADLDCGECFRIDGEDGAWTVHGGGALGVQYGLAALLEAYGWRFPHPMRTVRPDDVALVGTVAAGETVTPEMAQRTLHLHTLHPIEGYFAMWEPGADADERAARIVDWVVKNRGNDVQWPGLDDILRDAPTEAAWRLHTAAVVRRAHQRGVRAGLGIQLFGSGNLQQAFDLLESPDGDEATRRATIDERLTHLAGLDLDRINLSFGEFSGESAEDFIANVDLAYAAVAEALPGVEVSAVIHVGNYDDLRVEYQGQEYLYYFLVQFADPRIVPWIHSVMYYNLFEDAGGAYLHDEFDEHRQFLEDRLQAGEPAAYFPETAYWVAFDNPVPVWCPLYIRSRWTDLAELRDAGFTLDRQALFSSGWEWGYWQNDVAALRMSHTLPDSPRAALDPVFGDAELADLVAELADLQHDALIGARLAPYLASREITMDLGDSLGIVAAPDRPEFDEVAAMSADDRASFRSAVLSPLLAHAADTAAIASRIGALGDDPEVAEAFDGASVDALRAEYVARLYEAVADHADGSDPSAALTRADELAAAARVVIDRRHAALWDPDGERLVTHAENATIYDYGYLTRAEEMCFWTRERGQARHVVLGEDADDPGCSI